MKLTAVDSIINLPKFPNQSLARLLAQSSDRSSNQSKDGSSRLATKAESYLEAFGWPSRKLEDWKYTNINHLKSEKFQLALAPEKKKCLEFLENQEKTEGIHHLYIFDGYFIEGLSDKFLGTENIQCSLPDFSNASDFITHFSDLEDVSGDFVSSLNLVYAQNSVLVKIKKSLKKRLSITLLGTQTVPELCMSAPNLKILLSNSCEADVEVRISSQMKSVTMGRLDIKVLSQSRLKLSTLLEPDPSSTIAISNKINLEGSSHLDSVNLIRGSLLTRFDQHIKSNGPGDVINVGCAYLAQEKEQIQIISKVDHNFPGGQSRQNIKGLLFGQSRAIINGRIYIAPNAQKVDSSLSNHNLLLSPQAEVNTKPELEVEADDVKAAHGATVGHIDEEVLFYFASRGISEELSRKIFLRGFLQEILDPSEESSALKKSIEDYFGKNY